MEGKPNIIFFVPHDLGQHLGCYGIETVNTPAIDRLAEQGVRFENSFCTAPQCSPSRASIFTGRFPHNNGVMGLCHSFFAWDLRAGERHLAAVLSQAGWHTALVGNAHETRHPEKLGFDEILSGRRATASQAAKLVAGFPGTNTAQAAELSTGFLRRQKKRGRPFFLEVNTFEPHRQKMGFGHAPDGERGVTVPRYLVDELSSREEFINFQGAIRALDEAVGRIVTELDSLGLGENTIVVFTTDHGIPFPRAKCSLYDPGLEVALIVRWPKAGWREGLVRRELISNIDYLPTILELAGVSVPENVQGKSFAPLLQGKDYQPRREIFGEITYHGYCDPRRCLRTEDYKLIVNFTSAPFFMDPSQTWRRKCVTRVPSDPANAVHPPVELYALKADPLEENNLAGSRQHAEIRRELLKRLHEWMKETKDPLLKGIPVSPLYQEAMKALRNEAAGSG